MSLSIEGYPLMIDRQGRTLALIDGEWTTYGEKMPWWSHRRVLSMNLLNQNNKKNSSEWELHLDCGHSIREICGLWDSPKGMYRDCSPNRKH